MKRNLIVLLMALFFCRVLQAAQVTEQQWVSYGNYYYNQKAYDKAAAAYDNALKINRNNITALTFGGYAYIFQKNTQRGILYLENAFKLTNNAALGAQISRLKTGPGAMAQKRGQPALVKQNDSPVKWVVIGADALLAGGSIYAYMDSSKAGNDYDKLYDQINNTTVDNYNRLVSMKSAAEGKQAFFGLMTFLTGAAVVYTLADVFFLHAAFPVSASINPQGGRVMLALNREF